MDLVPRSLSVIHLSYTSLLIMSPNLDIFAFQHLLQVLPFGKILVVCQQTRPRLLVFHCTISLSRKKFLISKLFDDVIACGLVFLPPTKNSGLPMMTPSIKSQAGLHHFYRRHCRSVLVSVATSTTELNNQSD